jgi:protein kinase
MNVFSFEKSRKVLLVVVGFVVLLASVYSQSLRLLSHPNIVQLREVIREAEQLHFVFEFLSGNLYECIKQSHGGLSESRMRNVMFQCLQGIAHMHRQGYFHRDIKPENILVIDSTVKIADFGLARETRAKPPFTEYVSTRWYRAPEVLLRSSAYNSPVDIFAMGCIMAELHNAQPLFPGSSEADQIYKLAAVLGTPTSQDWPEGVQLATRMRFKWPDFEKVPLATLFPGLSVDATSLMQDLLQYNPQRRPSASAALQYPFFSAAIRPARHLSTPTAATAVSSSTLTSAQTAVSVRVNDTVAHEAAADVGGRQPSGLEVWDDTSASFNAGFM